MRKVWLGACGAVLLAMALANIDVSLCQYLDPDGYWYRVLGCDSGAPGGGGSGAGLP